MLPSIANGNQIADGIKVAKQLTLKFEDYPGLSVWAQNNHKGSSKWKAEAKRGQSDAIWKKFNLRCWLCKWQKGSSEPRNVSILYKPEKAKKQTPPRIYRRE